MWRDSRKNELERMKGGWRDMRPIWGIAVWTAGLALTPPPVLAQAAPTNSETPATDSVGPRELQNFSLSGTVTRPAEPQPAPAAPRTEAPASTQTTAVETARPRPVSSRRAEQARTASTAALSPAASQTPPSSANPTALPPSAPVATASPASPPPIASSPLAEEPSTAPATLAPERHLLLWPWLLAAFVAAGAAAFFLLRHRSRHAFAGGPQIDMFAAPEPAPAPPAAPPVAKAPQPAPAPTPPKPASSVPGGIVSTGLRPWVEVAMNPLRCIVEDAHVTFEFELELFNSGTAVARDILVEAMAFNAGPTQEQDIGMFFAKPAGEGDRIEGIPPLQRMTLKTQVVAPRENVQVLEAGGRQVFVPLLAFNALYGWNGREGQTSVSYLLGRDTKSDKMAPFRLDLGPRLFRDVGACPLPTVIRR
jgi:hypothetical protein